MQYTKRDWRNRNKIKTSQGIQWISIPVKTKGKFWQSIRETEINGDVWRDEHWKSLCVNYKKASCFEEFSHQLETLYLREYKNISELNIAFIEFICTYLGISTKIKKSWDYNLIEGKTERLVDLCLQSGATEYISGPAAKEYIQPHLFEDAGIALTWFNYEGYPEYPQLWGDFVHGVSILDLLFNCGKESPNYLRFIKSDSSQPPPAHR